MNILVHLLLIFIIANIVNKNAGFEEYVVSAVFVVCIRLIIGRNAIPKLK